MQSLYLIQSLSRARGSVFFIALPWTVESGGRPRSLGLSFFPANVHLAFGIIIEDSAVSRMEKKRVAEGWRSGQLEQKQKTFFLFSKSLFFPSFPFTECDFPLWENICADHLPHGPPPSSMLCKMSSGDMLPRSSMGRRVTGLAPRTTTKEVTLLGTFLFHFMSFQQVPFLGLLLAFLVGNIPDKGFSIKLSLLCGAWIFLLCQTALLSSSEQSLADGISDSPTISGGCSLGKSS